VADPGGTQANEEPARPVGPAVEPHWLTLRFPDGVLEQEFRREQAAKSLVPFRTSVLVGVLLYAAFGALDPFIIPEARRTAWAIRFLVVCPLGLASIGLSFTRGFAALLQPVAAVVGIVAGAGIAIMIFAASGPGGASYHSGLFLVLAFDYTLLRLRLPAAVVVSLSVSAVFLAGLPLGLGPGGATGASDVVFLLAFNVVGAAACYGMERSARLDFLHRKVIADQASHLAEALGRVKVLSGLVPVCAWCRKVRDDDGYWQQIEAYLTSRIDASFTHGICPDCMHRLEGRAP
jgi:hypothetical protein